MDRERYARGNRIRATAPYDFVNPYPWMPSTDARVFLELQHRRIPFAYRYFNAVNPYIKQLIPDWAPEFTLRDLKIVIIVQGAFFGNIPGVIQKNVLAKTILETEGWKVLFWFEYDIVSRLNQLFEQEPKLANPPVHGGEYTNPYGIVDIMSAFRALRARQKRYITSNVTVRSRDASRRQRARRGTGTVVGRRYRRPGREALPRRASRPTRRR